MSKNVVWSLFLVILVSACGQRTRPADDLTEVESGIFDSDAHQAFFNNLTSLCGQTFMGEQVYRSHHGDSWADKSMIMHITACDDGQIKIPFHVDDDESRTWIFLSEEGKLRFRHQHLHEDGTPEEGSLYGGYATDEGTAFMQYFPADDYTATVIEDGGGNVWTVSMDENLTQFSYRLDRDGEKRLELIFDLTNPVIP